MNYESNLTLMEMDSKARMNHVDAARAARALRARRRRVAGPQSGDDRPTRIGVISRLANVHPMEYAAATVAAVIVGGGVAGAVLLA